MPYDLQGNKIATRERLCNLTRVDLDAFSTLLREAFPGIRFWRSGLDNNGRIQEVASLADCGSSSSAVLHEPRSEEHTSELQSIMRISYAVFCLKNKTNNKQKQDANS